MSIIRPPPAIIWCYCTSLCILSCLFSCGYFSFTIDIQLCRHAVVCDVSSLQRVPGSLRYLSKLCREAGVPLYILNDPRTWGSQTHSTLSDAIVDMRKSISENIVSCCLNSMFPSPADSIKAYHTTISISRFIMRLICEKGRLLKEEDSSDGLRKR